MGCTERPSHRGYETVPQPCAARDMGHIDLCLFRGRPPAHCSIHQDSESKPYAECEIMNKSITFFAIFPVRCAGIEYFCVILQRSSEHRLIEITKRYARLANGNVRNFYCNARTVITVRAYSVDWLLHLHYKGTSHSLH